MVRVKQVILDLAITNCCFFLRLINPFKLHYGSFSKELRSDRRDIATFMDVTGNQKISAPRQRVFEALLNPTILQNSIPGCESAEQVDTPTGRQLKLTVSTGIPGFKGPYTIFVQVTEAVPPSRVVLNSGLGSVQATCATSLEEVADGTNLNYNAHADLSGKIANMPEIVLKGAIKVAMDQFFKNFEKQVSALPA